MFWGGGSGVLWLPGSTACCSWAASIDLIGLLCACCAPACVSLSCTADRYWKVPEESHLVFRSPSMAQHAVALVNNQEWVSGGCDGTLQVG